MFNYFIILFFEWVVNVIVAYAIQCKSFVFIQSQFCCWRPLQDTTRGQEVWSLRKQIPKWFLQLHCFNEQRFQHKLAGQAISDV